MIADELCRFRAVARYREHELSAAKVSTIGRKSDGSQSGNYGLDEQTIEELDIVETTDGKEEDILHNVIGQATEELWKHEYS